MQDEYHIKKHGISTPFNTIDDVGADFQYNINIILKGAWTLKREEGWGMYIEIQQLKDMGLNISQIARHLGISRPTVYEYINMSPDEFDKRLNKMQERCKKPDCYLDEILYWLREFPDLSSAQIYDRLEEKYNTLDFAESTLRNYVRVLREKYNIPKENTIRQYEAIEDPPMGRQMQVDFGEIWVPKPDKTKIKLYVMAFVLSHSRYKYCEWQDRPFRTSDIIRIHENAFQYFGGMPEEIVYDQDHLILVSENSGDLVYTHEFASYLKKRRFNVYMCRKSDPESKGRIENVIGFIKGNFAKNRIFYNMDRWNEDSLKWLERRGNGKTHGTTKKIPAEVFKIERKYLRPVTEKIQIKSIDLSIVYQVRKDNTVPISGSKYSVPVGTYKGPDTYVKVKKSDDGYIVIYDNETGAEIARHKAAKSPGELKKNTDHKRVKSSKIPELMDEVASSFSNPTLAKEFFVKIREAKPRYIRDQLLLIQSSIRDQKTSDVDKALNFCIKNCLYSAVDFKDAVNHYSKESRDDTSFLSDIDAAPLSLESMEKIKIKPGVRDISEYARLFGRK